MSAIDEYIRLATMWGVALQDGDSETANVIFDRVEEVFQDIRKQQLEGSLFDRASETTDSVAFFIASHMDEVGDPRSLQLYEKLAHSSLPFIGLSAKHILQEIRADRG